MRIYTERSGNRTTLSEVQNAREPKWTHRSAPQRAPTKKSPKTAANFERPVSFRKVENWTTSTTVEILLFSPYPL